MCNIDIMTDRYSHRGIRTFEKSHIIAFSDYGPRANPDVSSEERDSVDNYIILCPTCHTTIDSAIGEEIYTVNMLKKIKNEKEKRVRELMASLNNEVCMIIKYASNIGGHHIDISDSDIRKITFEKFFFTNEDIVNLSDNLDNEDTDTSKRSLDNSFGRVQRIIESGETPAWCVFALAPQPLLIHLGKKLGDKENTHIFIKHRGCWKYDDDSMPLLFEFTSPFSCSKDREVVLVISITSNESPDELKKTFGEEIDIWRIKVKNGKTGPDIITNQSELDNFYYESIKVLDAIGKEYGKEKLINVLPIMCNALAIKFGMAIMPKCHNPIIVFDAIKNEQGGISYQKKISI